MLISEAVRIPTAQSYLGPGEVLEADGQQVVVRIAGEEQVRAELALAFPYRPATGDLLLVIGHEGDHYVIGVLNGTGSAALEIQGDVRLRAVEGTLELSGDRGVKVEGPAVDVTTERLTILAGTLVQKCTQAFQRVRGLLTMRAGRSHTVVDEASYSKARNMVIVSDERVMINGKQIHLG